MQLAFAVLFTFTIGTVIFLTLHYMRDLFRSDFSFLAEQTLKVTTKVDEVRAAVGLREDELVIERTRIGDLRIAYRRSRFWFRSSYECVLSGTRSIRYRPGLEHAYEAKATADLDAQLEIVEKWLGKLAVEVRR